MRNLFQNSRRHRRHAGRCHRCGVAAAAAAQAAAAAATAAAAAAAAHATPSEAAAILDDEDDFLGIGISTKLAAAPASLGTSILRASPLLASPAPACATTTAASSFVGMPKSADDSPGSRAAPSHLAAAAFNALQPVGVAAAGGFNNGPSWKAAPTMPARDDPFDFDHIVSGLTPSEVASLLADVGDNL